MRWTSSIVSDRAWAANDGGWRSVTHIFGQRTDGTVIKEPSAVLMAIHAELLKGAVPVMSQEKQVMKPCNGNPARRLILATLKARLAALAGPDDVNMDALKVFVLVPRCWPTDVLSSRPSRGSKSKSRRRTEVQVSK
jgi:hypothetical protein